MELRHKAKLFCLYEHQGSTTPSTNAKEKAMVPTKTFLYNSSGRHYYIT